METVDAQIRDTKQAEPATYRAFVGTLFAFIFVAKGSSLVPGVQPPTAHLKIDAALALLVSPAIIWFKKSVLGKDLDEFGKAATRR